MSGETHEALLERFRAYLESAPEDTARDGADEASTAPETDLATLLTELAALRNEVRLESRQLKVALETFGGTLETLQGSNRRLARELDARGEAERRAVHEAEDSLLLELIELRERLAAGHAAAGAHRAGVLGRLERRSPRVIGQLGEGLGIALRRIDESLARRDVRPIPALGEPMDPHAMRAVGTAAHVGRADGTVVEEVRRGYRRGEAVLRLAEVIVSRTPSGKSPRTSPEESR